MPCRALLFPALRGLQPAGLDLVPQRLVDNRRMFAGIAIAFVGNLAAVKTVLKDQIKRPRENVWPPYPAPSGRIRRLLLIPASASSSRSA